MSVEIPRTTRRYIGGDRTLQIFYIKLYIDRALVAKLCIRISGIYCIATSKCNRMHIIYEGTGYGPIHTLIK
jgi:hypothetical protein